MELYENKIGIHTFELNLRLSSFDEYRERAAQLYNEKSDILNETGKVCGSRSMERFAIIVPTESDYI